MLRVSQHGTVRELIMSTAVTRAAGLRVSAFVHRGFLIDSGFPRVGAEMDRYVAANPVAGALITHWHEDHAGNLGLLVERGIPVAIGPESLAFHRAMPRVPMYRWVFWGHPATAPIDPVPAKHPFVLIPTPGHTPDHVAIWDPDERILFSGDMFLGVKAALAHHEYESPMANLASVRRVLALEPKVMFDAHRGLIRDPQGALTAKAQWLETTIVAIRRAIAAGDSDRRIVAGVLGGEDRIAFVSRGEMTKENFVRAIRRSPAR